MSSATIKPEYRQLSVTLSEEERMARALKAASKQALYDEIEDEKKARAKTLGDKLKELRSEIADLQRAVRTGSEVQPVQVEKRRNEERRTIELYRLDTGELVESRPMTVEERQGKLFAIDGGRPADVLEGPFGRAGVSIEASADDDAKTIGAQLDEAIAEAEAKVKGKRGRKAKVEASTDTTGAETSPEAS